MATNYVPRVNQIDASENLNQDIDRILQDQISKSLDVLSLHCLHRFQEELNLLSSTLTWICSVGRNYSTFGQQCLMIAYNKEQLTQSKQFLHFLLSVVGPYVKNKAKTQYVSYVHLQLILGLLENVLMALKVINFFRFLKYGTKPSLLDYTLQLDHISMAGIGRRNVGYSFMTRELIWGGFTEFLGFTIPLMNYPYIKRKFLNMFRLSRANVTAADDGPVKVGLTSTTKCAYCNSRPTLPYSMGCPHVFCYYCLAGNKLADENFHCNICDWQSDSWQIVNVSI